MALACDTNAMTSTVKIFVWIHVLLNIKTLVLVLISSAKFLVVSLSFNFSKNQHFKFCL